MNESKQFAKQFALLPRTCTELVQRASSEPLIYELKYAFQDNVHGSGTAAIRSTLRMLTPLRNRKLVSKLYHEKQRSEELF